MKKGPIFVLAAVLSIVVIFAVYGRSGISVKADPEESVSAQLEASLPDNTVIMYIGSPKAFINGDEAMIIKDEPQIAPYISNGSTFVPLRFVADAFGVTTTWNPETRTAVISAAGKQLTVTEGSNVLYTGQTSITMNAAAENRDGRLYLPARYIAEALGYEVFYDRGLIVISREALSLDPEKDRDYIDGLFEAFTGLKRVGSKEKLTELLGINEEDFRDGIMYDGESLAGGGGSSSLARNEAATNMVVQEAPAAAPAPTAEASMDTASFESGYSQTNVQVAGVDEADIIKTDGEYIYYVRGDKIDIVRAHSDGSLEQMSQIRVRDSFELGEIFVDSGKIVAVGQAYAYQKSVQPIMPFIEIEAVPDMAVRSYYPYSTEYTKAVVYDTADKKNPKLERTVELKGRYVSSRKTGDSVYFITSSGLYYGNLDDATPVYRDSAIGTSEIRLGWDRVYHFPVISGHSITSIAGFTLGEPDKAAKIETFLGAGDNIYMSERNLYIAAQGYNDYRSSAQTDIYKFAISNGDIVYSNKGSIPGTLLNQFSMDEHNGYFRAGTTVYRYLAASNGPNQSNCLYVLDGSMQTVGKIEDIAPGERIYSVRFMGDRAYMVTFKQVDPLFAMDLSNPREPKIMGALKIPGYSDYLHPYDENHLIGFGKDTTLDSYGNAFYLGMKMSMFDITDITNPKEMFTEYIGDRGTESELLYNHKALLFSKERELLAFPVTLYEVKNKNRRAGIEYGEFSGYYGYVYSVNLTDGFKLRGRLTHMTTEDFLKASAWGGNYDKSIERLLYIGKQLYTASKSVLMSSNIESLTEIDRLEFK